MNATQTTNTSVAVRICSLLPVDPVVVFPTMHIHIHRIARGNSSAARGASHEEWIQTELLNGFIVSVEYSGNRDPENLLFYRSGAEKEPKTHGAISTFRNA